MSLLQSIKLLTSGIGYFNPVAQLKSTTDSFGEIRPLLISFNRRRKLQRLQGIIKFPAFQRLLHVQK